MLKNLILVILLIIMPVFLWPGDYDEIIENKSITVGMRQISSATYLGEEYTNKGFCHDIAKAFAKDLGVDLNIKVIDHFSRYWKKDGKILFKSDLIATPDIYNEIDLAADIITVSEQREQYVNMVPFIENTEIFIGKKELNIKDYEELRGLRIFTFESLAFYKLLISELSARDIPYVVNPVNVEVSGELNYIPDRIPVPADSVEILVIPSNTTYPKFILYTQILLDHADITVQDSFSFFLHYSSSNTYREGLRTMFPLKNELGYLAFCSSYDTKKLNSRLADFLIRYKKSDEYKEMFKHYMGISSEDYINLLSITQKVYN